MFKNKIRPTQKDPVEEVKESNFKYQCGETVKDKITGFQGVVTARTQWMNNCNTYAVQPRELKDGEPVSASHFDEPQLESVKTEPKMPLKQDTGGPVREVKRTTF